MMTAVMKKSEAVSSGRSPALWKLTIGAGGMIFGALLLVAALILWGFSGVEGVNRDYKELVLIAASFVSVGIGAHGLDLVRDEELEERKQRLNL
jgi:cytochrome c biogenesis protein CcdA